MNFSEHTDPDDTKLKALLGDSKELGFGVPDNYFNELTETLNFRLNHEEPAQLDIAGLNSDWPSVDIPGYFDALKREILAKTIQANQESDKDIALPGSHEPFIVPEIYFTEMKGRLMEQVASNPNQIKPYIKKSGSSKILWIRYSAIAASLILAGGAIWILIQNPATDPKNNPQTAIGQNDTLNETESPTPSNDGLMFDFANLTYEEIELALKNEDIPEDVIVQYADLKEPNHTKPASKSKQDISSKKHGETQVSEEEIELYLMEHTDETLTEEL